MRLGLDFDNTIVSYDSLFHKVALEQGVVPPDTPPSKLAVRDHLRRVGQEDIWTEMQGYVYGARMMEAATFPGVVECLHWARQAGIEVSIVSHKTKHPFIGPAYDLHAIARQWIEHHLSHQGQPLIPGQQIFFELTKDSKLARITECGFDFFLDDLPEILTASGFPAQRTGALLFDPAESESLPDHATRLSHWDQVKAFMGRQCTTKTS